MSKAKKTKKTVGVKKGAKNITNIVKILFYAITFLFPAFGDKITEYVNNELDLFIYTPDLVAVAVSVISLAAVFFPSVFNLLSSVILALGSFILSIIFSRIQTGVDSGLSTQEAIFAVMPTIVIISFGLLFAYIATSDSYFFGSLILRNRCRKSRKAKAHANTELRKAKRRLEKHTRKNRKYLLTNRRIRNANDNLENDVRAKEIALDKKNAAYAEDRDRTRPPVGDLAMASSFIALPIAILFSVAVYFIFTYAEGNAILEFIKNRALAELIFIFIDVILFILGPKYSKKSKKTESAESAESTNSAESTESATSTESLPAKA